MAAYEIRIYATAGGRKPFVDWIDRLGERRTVAKVQTRIARLSLGHVGDFRSVGSRVFELRIDWGSGIRIYYARIGEVVMLLLCGGDKSTQQKDIERAKAYLKDYEARGGSADCA